MIFLLGFVFGLLLGALIMGVIAGGIPDDDELAMMYRMNRLDDLLREDEEQVE